MTRRGSGAPCVLLLEYLAIDMPTKIRSLNGRWDKVGEGGGDPVALPFALYCLIRMKDEALRIQIVGSDFFFYFHTVLPTFDIFRGRLPARTVVACRT